MATYSLAFPSFANLPYELRHRIWCAALPVKDGPTLFCYKKGCFGLECVPRYDTETHIPEFHFHRERLGSVQVQVPFGLLSANTEARGIALAWAREQGFQMHRDNDRGYHIFERAFEPKHDTLYFDTEMFENFESLLLDYYWVSESQRRFTDYGQAVTSIAVPDTLFSTRMESTVLSDALHWFRNIAVLYVIINPPPDLRGQDDHVAQRRYELTSRGGSSLFWNVASRSFDLAGDGEIDDKPLCRLLKEVCEELMNRFVEHDIGNFEVRTVFAVEMATSYINKLCK